MSAEPKCDRQDCEGTMIEGIGPAVWVEFIDGTAGVRQTRTRVCRVTADHRTLGLIYAPNDPKITPETAARVIALFCDRPGMMTSDTPTL